MITQTVYWWLRDMGCRKCGHDAFTVEQELLKYEIEDLMCAVGSSDERSDRKRLEELMPNFVEANGCATNPEDWGVRKIRSKEISK